MTTQRRSMLPALQIQKILGFIAKRTLGFKNNVDRKTIWGVSFVSLVSQTSKRELLDPNITACDFHLRSYGQDEKYSA